VLRLVKMSTMMPARERIRGWTIIPRIMIDVAVPGIETVEARIGTAVTPVREIQRRPDMSDARPIIIRAQVGGLRRKACRSKGTCRDRGAEQHQFWIAAANAIHLSPTGSMICH
jgi:hypothetical protein